MGDLRLRLLGGFAATVDGVPDEQRWRLRKAKTLVKLLALASGHRLHRDALIEALWPETDPAAATNNLHQALHAARRALGSDQIVLRDDVVLLDAVEVDVDDFEECAEQARRSNTLDDLRAAAALWSGELLPEDPYEPWLDAYRTRLHDIYDAVIAQLGAALVETGEADEAVVILEPLARDRPVDEPLHRALISALAAAGQRFEAVAAYEALREALDTEYAAELQPETKALYRRLLGVGAPQASAPHNLPVAATSFVGRHRELVEVAALLQRHRLVTLTGPGGAGKTRLALEVGRRRVETTDHPDGVWLVELAGLTEADLVPSTVGSVLDVAVPEGASALALAEQLVHRSVLLVLDNCEHLVSACADLVATVLARCPDVVVLTTSREPLGLPGEVTWRVPSLALPAIDGKPALDRLARLEAVQLFVERAREAVPGFQLDESNAPAVAEICYRLDGIPLALELAAARLAHLSVSQLADRLGDALVVLASRGRGRLDRQQTLAATLDWSYELLDGDERMLFRRLAVFAGGFDADAAARICGDDIAEVVDVLARLVDKSLVHADTGGDVARYRLHEVVRQYAEARLAAAGELARCRRRHREWFAERAHANDPDRSGPVVGEPSAWFDVEQDNLRLALSSALVEDAPLALQLATSTWRFWMTRGQIAEGARWLTLALDGWAEVSPLRARALFARAVLMVRQGRAGPLLAMADEIGEVRQALGDPSAVAQGAHERSMLLFMAGDYHRAYPLIDETLALANGSPTVSASAQHFTGLVALGCGDIPEARRLWDGALSTVADVPNDAPPFFTALTLGWIVDPRFDPPLAYGEETILLGRRVGAEQARGYLTTSIALTERLSGRVEEARDLLDDAIARFRGIGDNYGMAYAVGQLGHTLRWAGDFEAALPQFEAALEARRALRDQRAIAMTLCGRAVVEAHLGRADAARSVAAQATELIERSGDGAGIALVLTNAAIVEVLLGDPGAALGHLDHAVINQTIPGTHRASGWHHLMRAGLLHRLDDDDAATDAAASAQRIFTLVREQQGLELVLRVCKDSRLTFPS